MGLFDDVKFGFKNTILPPDLNVSGTWQTKDLYNCLYHLAIDEDKLFYVDRTGKNSLLPVTSTFEVHDYDENGQFWSYNVTVVEGSVTKIVKNDTLTWGPLPQVEAMVEDAEKWAENLDKNIGIFQEKWKKKSFYQKFKTKFRVLCGELKYNSVRSSQYSFKKFFSNWK